MLLLECTKLYAVYNTFYILICREKNTNKLLNFFPVSHTSLSLITIYCDYKFKNTKFPKYITIKSLN